MIGQIKTPNGTYNTYRPPTTQTGTTQTTPTPGGNKPIGPSYTNKPIAPNYTGSIGGYGHQQTPPFTGPGNINLSNPFGTYAGMYGAAAGSQGNMYGLLAKNQPGILAGLQQGENRVLGGYGNLDASVQNMLGMGHVLGKNGNWGIATPAAQQINRQQVMNSGNITQQMQASGLGNSSLGGNLQNQLGMQTQQAYGNLGAQLAGTAAGYHAGIGQQALGYAGNANQYNAGFAQNQLQGLANMGRLPYPDLGGYTALQGQMLQNAQFQQQMALQRQALMQHQFSGGVGVNPGALGGGGGGSPANMVSISGAAHGPLPTDTTKSGNYTSGFPGLNSTTTQGGQTQGGQTPYYQTVNPQTGGGYNYGANGATPTGTYDEPRDLTDVVNMYG